jgi:cytochrome P450
MRCVDGAPADLGACWRQISACGEGRASARGRPLRGVSQNISEIANSSQTAIRTYVRHNLSDDLISELIRAEDDGDRLTHDELVNLVAILLNAGTETTRNQLAAAVEVLSEHQDQWALLAEHPELAPKAVEELMRHSPIVFASLRVATTDIELDDVLIPAGAFVLANTAAANRDPAVYDHPDRLDITRQGPAPMLTFGGGAHYCLGAHLARVELAEALRVITAKMSNARRTGPAPWKPITELSGPTTLPIEFTGRVASLR